MLHRENPRQETPICVFEKFTNIRAYLNLKTSLKGVTLRYSLILMILGWSCIISLITFSSSFVLASEANDWSLILLDYCWFFNNIYILIVEGLNYNILRKNSLTFLIRTLSFWKKLLFFVKKGLTKFQNVLFETILFLMKVIKWNESF